MDGYAGRLGVHGETAQDGQARLELDAGEEHLNPAGTLHGGVLATLVDTAMGLAARSTLGEQDAPATSQLTVAYLRAGSTGQVVATARVRKQGEHLLLAEADVEQDGRALVHAVATFALVTR
jgi:uncharacterized protein (TIGR00369 family)